jgi:uncharacterized protein YcbK (DUF882 family)
MRMHRRTILKGLVALPLLAAAAPAYPLVARRARSLSFRHLHTDERLSVTYFEDGEYLPRALASIDHLLRDFRTGAVHRIDPALLDTLHTLTERLGEHTFEVISGFRSLATNRWLRKHGNGVSSKSLHLQGRAIDVRVAGLSTARVRDAAMGLARGGVGYYPDSDFVHLDTGRVRRW